ncbi:MAG: dihydropteroate synthase, partial [Gemmatimonadetes bacterium]|nr:dihydropteroate synthase [Gemmatimonadota bacterium]
MGKQPSRPMIRIAESLHCHIPGVRASAQRWLVGDDIDRLAGEKHLQHLVTSQVANGADFLDVNVDNFFTMEGIGYDGARQVLAHILDLIAEHGGGVPPCVDSSDPSMLEFGLRHYHEKLGGERTPLVNSVTVNRLEALEMRQDLRFAVVGMLLEKAGDDAATGFTDIADASVYHETAKQIFEAARAAGFEAGDVFFDPTVGPLGADMVGYTKRTFEGIKMIRDDADMAGSHVVLGLSNCSDGLPRRLAINRAYLRVAMEYGVDAAICDVGQISGKDLVDGKILKLIRKIATGESMDALTLLVDYAQSQRRAPKAASRQTEFDDPFGRALADPDGDPVFMLELAPAEGGLDEIFAIAEEVRDEDYIFTITDTPGGNRTPGPDTLAVEVARISGRQPIMNLSCKSDDRNALIRRALALYHQGLHHFFAISGDYTNGGRPVFDLDAVSLSLALDTLRRGLNFPDLMPRPGGALEHLQIGAAVSPFKYSEADTWGQYLKVWKKRKAGANYLITQLGYDVAKFQELKMWMTRAGIGDMPVFPMVYFLTPQFLKVLNKVHVAGAVIPDELKKKYQGKLGPKDELKALRGMNFSEVADFHRKQSVRRAALQCHILLDGLKFRGIDLAGITQLDDARAVRDELASLSGRNWLESWEEFRDADGDRPMDFAPIEDAFYLFEHADNGLLREDSPIVSGNRSGYEPIDPKLKKLHARYFEEGKGLNGILKWMVGGCEDGAKLRWATQLEQATKSSKLGCEMCGDCRIPDLAYMCPEPTSGCAKRLLNGPCAGAALDGGCEVIPERRCYWGRVIEATLADGQMDGLFALQPPKDP